MSSWHPWHRSPAELAVEADERGSGAGQRPEGRVPLHWLPPEGSTLGGRQGQDRLAQHGNGAGRSAGATLVGGSNGGSPGQDTGDLIEQSGVSRSALERLLGVEAAIPPCPQLDTGCAPSGAGVGAVRRQGQRLLEIAQGGLRGGVDLW